MNHVRHGAAALLLAACLVPAAGAEGPEARPGAAAPPTAGASDLSPAQELTWKARRMELDYRDRLARLHRLREIAVKTGDRERLAEVERLSQKAQQRHAERVGLLQDDLDPEARARLDEELCAGRDPREVAEFRARMKEKAAQHREDMKEKHAEFRSDMKEKDAEFRKGMKDDRLEFREEMKGKAAEHRGEMKEKRAELRTDVKEQNKEFRTGVKDERSEFRGEMKDRRAEHREGMKGERVEHRKDLKEQHGEFRAGMKDERREFREAARAANERDWEAARDRARAETTPSERDEAIKRIAAGRADEEARRGRDGQWRKAAMRDGSLGDDLGPFRRPEARNRFRMPTQKEADELATLDIAEADAEAELQRLREELAEQ
jgi:hypothetical protein